ncbi:MAG TPA: ATP synthase F1 subunit gamma [Dysgonamonadaceae bacterium]|jgi:F-type H+-transporting ATPase subunit gamma|nr:ATP synthase F1 subunit gamma [Dysgonamonadaceae bacterium]HXL00893.1 ATP synthase F1 subunit gamma [Dysgonamonadaceae bacterium]
MPPLKEIKHRIVSVKNIQQVTSAMKLVSAAKLQRSGNAIQKVRPYQNKLYTMATRYFNSVSPFPSPYLMKRKISRVAIVAVASNTSLCGSFNVNLVQFLEKILGSYENLGKENILIYPIGKKVEDALKKMDYPIQGSYQNLADNPTYAETQELTQELIKQFNDKNIDRVEIVYHHFKSKGSIILTRKIFLPMVDLIQNEKNNLEYIVEPSPLELTSTLLPLLLYCNMYFTLLNASASEHATRMIAMQIATDNAGELLSDLTLQYNKSRQQAITNELLDIIGGSMQ